MKVFNIISIQLLCLCYCMVCASVQEDNPRASICNYEIFYVKHWKNNQRCTLISDNSFNCVMCITNTIMIYGGKICHHLAYYRHKIKILIEPRDIHHFY